jgi:acyl-coenzyme A synthetase/AMP-(fatty) acid ligase
MSKLEFAAEMQARTKRFAVQVIKFFAKLPKTDEGKIMSFMALMRIH